MAESDSEAIDLFQEPADYFEAEKPATFATHRLRDGRELTLRLVGHNPLWGHILWNAGRTIADYIEDHQATLIQGKTILELGAGAGLPSLVAALRGASYVVVTDYPDADLVDNLRHNVEITSAQNTSVEGYLWGAPVESLLCHLPSSSKSTGFDVLILADLLFNHSEHSRLVTSVRLSLRRSVESRALVFFTPYRPWLLDKDLAFFDLAEQSGFEVEKILEIAMDKVLFEDDPGDELVRRTVHGFMMRWQMQELEKAASSAW